MRRASYREAIAWIASNDGDGDDCRLDEREVGYLVTSCLVADVFGVPNERVGRDVVRERVKADKADALSKGAA